MKRRILPTNVAIVSVILVGFLLTGLSAYYSFQKLFMADVEAVSELTSENISANINNLMDRPINISLTMAHDTLLRDFLEVERQDGLRRENVPIIQGYLAAYQKKYDFDSVFFVSVASGAYYHYENGIDRVMIPQNMENAWYYDFIQSPVECALNVDNDEASADKVTIFVNCKLLGEQGALLGVIGVGMTTPYLQDFLQVNEEKYGVNAYLIDKTGEVQLSSQLTQFADVNLFAEEAFSGMKEAVLSATEAPVQRWYHTKDADGYIISKFIPDLNWYLVVEKNTEEFHTQMVKQMLLVLVFMLAVVSVVVTIVTGILRKNHRTLEALAERDQLTGIRNRTAYEWELRRCYALLSPEDSFGIGVFDLNNLKRINDTLGHQTGDAYLQEFAALLCATFPHCAIFRIGGDEFAVFFRRLEEEHMLAYYAMLREAIAQRNISCSIPMETAFGYAYRRNGKPDSLEELFKLADNRMYQDKVERKQS